MREIIVYGSEVGLENEQESVAERSSPGTPVDVHDLESAFLRYCLANRWLSTGPSDEYYITAEGKAELARFGISHLS